MPAMNVVLWVPCLPMRMVLASPATPRSKISMMLLPVVRFSPALLPTATWSLLVVLRPTARAAGESAKHASTNGMRRNACRKGKRFIRFLNGRVVVFIMRRVLKKSGHLGKTNWDAVIRVYNESGAVIETHEHAGDFKEC